MLPRGVERAAQVAHGVSAPAEDLARRDEEARVIGGLEEKPEGEGVRRPPAPRRLGAVGIRQIEPEARTRHPGLGADCRARPGLELGEQYPLLESRGGEVCLGRRERGDEAPLPRHVGVRPPARAHRLGGRCGGTDERVGRRVEEGPKERRGRPHLGRPRATVPAAAAHAIHVDFPRHGMGCKRKDLHQRRHAIRVLGQGERDGEPRLGAPVRGHQARDQALAPDQVER